MERAVFGFISAHDRVRRVRTPRGTLADLWHSNSGVRDDKERVRDASDIARIIGEHLSLKPKGREYVCLCPFHNDHNPSMRVIPAKQIFHCFVCGTGGDVFTFVMKFHKMEFREALEFLAERAGVTLSQKPRPETADSSEVSRRETQAACDAAATFYRQVLAHADHGRVARDVLARRRISAEMTERFGIGAAPDRWDGLILAARQRSIREEALLAAGLLKPRDSGGCYDLLRNRLIFPIHDRTGRVIAFGGRKLREEDEPKYLNSPETRLFNKSATLFALHLASRQAQAERTVIVTEGYTDAIACHQAGFSNTVATLGTALTTEHAAVLRPLCETVILLFDGDDAGQRAADRAVRIFFSEPLDVRIATLNRFTDAKDPDELLKRDDGAAIFKNVLSAATDLLEYRFARVRARLAGAGLAAVSRAIREEIDALADMGLRDVEPVRQQLIVRRLAELGDLDESTILKVLPAGRSARPASPAPDAPASQLPNLAAASLSTAEHLLGCLLADGSLWNAMGDDEKDLIAPASQRFDALRKVAQCVLDIGEDGQSPDLPSVLRLSDNEDVKSAAVALCSRLDLETEGNSQRLHDHWRACLRRALLDRAHRPESDGHVEIKQQSTVESESTSVIDRLRERKRSHAAWGPDRRRFPRRG